jgi:hypothetical protein
VRGSWSGESKKIGLGKTNATSWGAACAEACCAAGATACRFWSVMGSSSAGGQGECSLFSRYAKPSSLPSNDTRAATAISGAVYYGAASSNPYSALKGFNYFPASSMNDIDYWRDYDEAAIERELGWAAAAGLNFCRTWFNFVVWRHEGAASLKKLQHFVATAHALGIQVMVAPFNNYNSCISAPGTVPLYDFTSPCFYTSPAAADTLNTSWWHADGHAYVDALVTALPASTPGLLLWDVCNEPSPGWLPFVLHFVRYFQSKTGTPTTVGVAHPVMNTLPALNDTGQNETVGQAVDVLSFHSYFPSWEGGLQACDDATALAEQLNKHVFLSEFGCIARANAYDQGIEVA